MRYAARFLLFVMSLTIAPFAHAGEVLDRIVATVNRGIVLQSDVDLYVRYHAFLHGQPLEKITDADMKSALDHLIDQQLLLQEMGESNDFAPSATDMKDAVAELRKEFPEGRDEASWKALLQRYGLTEQDLADGASTRIRILRFVDLRLRPNVHIDDAAIESYYREEFLPKLRQAGAKDVALSVVSERIRQIVAEQRIDELLAAWLHNLRDQNKLDSAADAQSSSSATREGGDRNAQ